VAATTWAAVTTTSAAAAVVVCTLKVTRLRPCLSCVHCTVRVRTIIILYTSVEKIAVTSPYFFSDSLPPPSRRSIRYITCFYFHTAECNQSFPLTNEPAKYINMFVCIYVVRDGRTLSLSVCLFLRQSATDQRTEVIQSNAGFLIKRVRVRTCL